MPSVQVIRQRERDAQDRLKACLKEMGEILGVENVEAKVEPQYPARIKREPIMLNLSDRENLAGVAEEMLEKLRAYEIKGEAPVTSLEEIDGIGPDLVKALNESGVYSLEDLRGANDNDLLEIDGIGKSKLKKLKEQIG